MGRAIVTLKIMPESPSTDLEKLQASCESLVDEFSQGDERQTKVEPIGFGLKSINITFVMNEDLGDTEVLENKISKKDEVASVEVTDVRRAIG